MNRMRRMIIWFFLCLLILPFTFSQDQQEQIKQALKTIDVEVKSGKLSTEIEGGDRRAGKIVVEDGSLKVTMAGTLKPAALDSPTLELRGKSSLEFDSAYGKVIVSANPIATVSLLRKISVFTSPSVQIQGRTLEMSGTGSITFEHDGRIKLQPRGLKMDETLKILGKDGRPIVTNLRPGAQLNLDLSYIPENAQLSKSRLDSLCQQACIISTPKGLEFRGQKIQSMILKRSDSNTPFGKNHMRHALSDKGVDLVHVKDALTYADTFASLMVTKRTDGSSSVVGYRGIPIFTLSVPFSTEGSVVFLALPNERGELDFFIEGSQDERVGTFSRKIK